MGIDKSYGVVVDLAPVKGASVLGADRVVSSDPTVVANYAKAYIAGANKAGVKAVAKHWLMGSATKNTDNAPALVPNYEILKTRDVKVYDILRNAGVKFDAMIGSEYIPGLTITAGPDKKLGTTDDVKIPASMSPEAVAEFKADLADKNAVTVTDDLGAPAISGKYKVDAASIATWKAGIDQALFVNTTAKISVKAQLDQTINAGVAALKKGELNRKETEASVMRILGRKGLSGCGVLKTVDSGAYKELEARIQKQPSTTTKKAPSTPSPTPAPTKSALPTPAVTKPSPSPTPKAL
jgi:beta-glucosidase-like glycosyl hydrolase